MNKKKIVTMLDGTAHCTRCNKGKMEVKEATESKNGITIKMVCSGCNIKDLLHLKKEQGRWNLYAFPNLNQMNTEA